MSFCIFILHYSQIDSKLLYGNWIVTNKKMSDGSRYFSQMPTSNPYKIYYFKKEGYFTKEFITDPESFINFSLKVKDSIIISDNIKHYKIEKLTQDELILLDVNDKKIEKSYARYYLTRYETARKNDLEKFADQDPLNTTPALSPFPKYGIFADEFKNDNDQPFKTKGYLIFDLEKMYIQTILTDITDISTISQNKLKDIFRESYKKWNFSKVSNLKHIRMPFVAIGYKIKIQNSIFSNISVGYNISEYEQITLPMDTNRISEAEKYNSLAVKCFENEDYSCSVENFKKSFLQNKYNLDAHYNYAAINLALGKKDLACQKWKELIGYGQKEAEKEFTTNKCEN